jgi:signal transduction histidine kinase
MDHGRGMSPEQAALLTGKLQQGAQTSEKVYPGIGLAIVKRLAEMHLGSFSIQSQPKQWTVMVVRLPLSD